MSKHSYNNGIVIIKCDGCGKLHLIADRLGWFSDSAKNGVDVESILSEKGEQVQKSLNGENNTSYDVEKVKQMLLDKLSKQNDDGCVEWSAEDLKDLKDKKE